MFKKSPPQESGDVCNIVKQKKKNMKGSALNKFKHFCDILQTNSIWHLTFFESKLNCITAFSSVSQSISLGM